MQAAEKVGPFVGMLTIVGTIIGGGIVGLPYATIQTGFLLGKYTQIYLFIDHHLFRFRPRVQRGQHHYRDRLRTLAARNQKHDKPSVRSSSQITTLARTLRLVTTASAGRRFS